MDAEDSDTVYRSRLFILLEAYSRKIRKPYRLVKWEASYALGFTGKHTPLHPLFTIYFILFIILLLYSFAPLSSWKDSSSFFLHIHMSMILSLFLIRKKHMTKQPQLYNCSQIYDLNFVATNGGEKTI